MKFVGKIGFWEEDVETSPGVYKPSVVERKYTGDVIRDNRRFQNNTSQNGEFSVRNQISILSDIFLQRNWSSIKYVVWNDKKLAVTGVEVNHPRINLEIGGDWNGSD